MESTVTPEMIQKYIDIDLENKIRLGAYLYDIKERKVYKDKHSNFWVYLQREYPNLNTKDVTSYINLYKMCSHLGIKFRDLKDVPWWRIKAFMRYITQHNKDDMLQAAQNLSTKNYKQYINDQEKTQIIQRQKAIIYVPLQKYEKIHGQLEAIKYAHKFAYLYEVLEYLLKTNVEKQEYHKEKKLNNLIDETPLDDVLQILTQKYPHMLIEITELEGYENA